MRNKALVVGSVGFDYIFAIHGNMKEKLPLKEGKLSTINIMFRAKNKEVYYGGTGGNIAYGLGLLSEKPMLFSVVGHDFFTAYAGHLEKVGVNLKLFHPKGGVFSSNFYGISDEHYQQIGIFQPNVYAEHIDEVKLKSRLSNKDFESTKVAIFSPGTGVSTRNHMLEFYKKVGDKATIIFDPSEEATTTYDEILLKECLSLANIFISNGTELNQIKRMYRFSVKEILNIGVKYVIETLGKKGSIIHSKEGQTRIPIKKPRKVVETTGAGDAFRAGLIHGLLHDKSIQQSAKIGAMVASYSVEEYGGQGYTVPKEKLQEL